MTNENKHNGWTNYETWLVNLWIDNDQGLQEYWQKQAELTYKFAWKNCPAYLTQKENATLILADSIKDSIEETNPLADKHDLFADLINGALSEVNWHEIAANIIDGLDIEEESEAV